MAHEGFRASNMTQKSPAQMARASKQRESGKRISGKMKIIDTHQHLIYPDRLRNPWTKDVPALAGRPFRLEEYRAAARGTGITETLFMEVDVMKSQIKMETEFFLKHANDPKSGIVGVPANCRPESENFPAYLESVLHPKLKGLRCLGLFRIHTYFRQMKLQIL
jgi:predicted TIM-barrel fold metal-dependent hydrolase